jgi:chemotaxis family two-component system sensor kinase Cph1
MTTLDPGFIDACEDEALHRIGAIQPYGALLGGDIGDPRVRCASADVGDWVGRVDAGAIGRPVTDLLADADGPGKDKALRDLEQGLARAAPPQRGHAEKLVLVDLIDGPRGPLDGLLSCTASDWVLELQPALPSDQQQEALRPVPHALYRMPHSEAEWEAHCRLLAEQMRRISGFDRVMVYRFLPDGCGEVIAECAQEDLSPYLGLRYPASDIPRIARELYRANRHRQIPNVDAEPVPLLAEPGYEPDLTLSDLRAVSPVHIEYLHNMEVTASLSFSVVLNGELWGLIACHHHSPRPLPLQLRERCADLVQVFSLGVSGRETSRRLAAISDSDRNIARLTGDIDELEVGAFDDYRIGDQLLALAEADGAVLVDTHGNRPVAIGRTPPTEQLNALLRWLDEAHPEPIFATDCLSSLYPAAEGFRSDASGLLAVRVSSFAEVGGRGGGGERTERRFLWLRPEQPQTVYWAGDPRKSTLFDTQSQQLSPRSSFSAWLETKTGHSEPWSETVLLSAKKFRSLLLRKMNADLLR